VLLRSRIDSQVFIGQGESRLFSGKCLRIRLRRKLFEIQVERAIKGDIAERQPSVK
jgi:hypothetical protein